MSETATSMSILDAACAYVRAGRAVVPVPRGRKGPVIEAWQKLRLTESDLPHYFGNGENNVGILLGEPSRHFTDVDLDCLEALALWSYFLPQTDLIHGRPGKPASHRWYISEGAKLEQFEDVDGTMLVELRSTRGQTLVPPSVHPSGEVLGWECEGTPAVVDATSLRAAVARLAAAAILARHWPEKGSRHQAGLAVPGLLLRGGTPEEDVALFIEAVARAAGDEEWQDRVRAVRDTARELAEGSPATGAPRLAELLRGDGAKVVGRVQRWLGLRAPQRVAPDSCYVVDGGRICRKRETKDGPVVDPLANFAATVSEEVIQDDGAETTRAFVIQGRLETGEPLPPARVPAARFAGMSWVTEHWGLRAVVRAGQTTKDYLREAIQRLSPDAPQRRVFTHTGWREIGGEWFYLTSNGAVGRDGFEVELGPDLARYRLPRQAEDPVGGMRASLRLLDLAPLTVTAPMWAGTFRAPLASALPLDIAIWIEAQTGNLKSTLAALFLCHYGSFDRTNLSTSWSSTANQLERRAFVLKDMVCVVDEYAPSALDARELESKAGRLIRAQGNLAGRGRLRSDLTERPAFPPRGLIVSTGEQHPPGQSLLARMLVVEPRRQEIDLPLLSEAQRQADRLAHAMAGYVTWLAPQMAKLPALLRATFEGTRARVLAGAPHLRVPEALAHLWVGLHCGLAYAEDIGACSESEAEALRARCWDALVSLGGTQGRLVEDERPSRRFLRVLLTMVTQGRALLLPREANGDGGRPGMDLVGWQDEEAVFLLPEAAHHAVSRFCRDAGEPMAVRRERLQKDLAMERLTQCDPGRHTKVERVGGSPRRVLSLKRQAVADLLGEDFPLPPVTGVTGFGE